jgi:hypothetical protein
MTRSGGWPWRGALLLLTLQATVAPLAAQGAPAGAPAPEGRPSRAVNRLPAQLADSTFWRLVTELSEPGGWFRSENYVSNETDWQVVIPSLTRAVPSGHAYLGVGPEQNFTYLAALDPGIAFIVDIRRQNLALHLYYKALFELSPTREVFLARLFGRPLSPATADGIGGSGGTASNEVPIAELLAGLEQRAPDSAWHAGVRAAVRTHLVQTHGFSLPADDLTLLERVAVAFATAGPDINYSYVPEFGSFAMVTRGMPTFGALFRHDDGAGVNRSFLGSEAAYQRVRTLQQRNLVVPVTGDFAGAHALRAVGDWLRAHAATVGTFYLSNVEQYLFQENDVWPRFFANVQALPVDSTSTFIRSVANRWRGGWSAGSRPGPLMTQRLAPIAGTLDAVRAGRVLWYGDVIAVERPPE